MEEAASAQVEINWKAKGDDGGKVEGMGLWRRRWVGVGETLGLST